MSGDGICVHMNGALCALQYCDYYDPERQRCSLALESQARADIMIKFLEKIEDMIADIKNEESAMKFIRELNVVLGSKTIQ